ncbi:hypothetical protein F4806DRAFT_28518 [Annulohypoxylon nitens]|nr:hypothetical protein F4806DRAFT_28518 [Annulohypoxylon nitens]
MKELHSFEASQKLYKDKFKLWGWQKNLSSERARFMAEKAEKRKREDGKDTVFLYRGQTWTRERVQSSASRAKRARTDGGEDIETPQSVSYKTPMNLVQTPASEDSGLDDESIQETSREADHAGSELKLRWQGHSRSNLLAMRDTARQLIGQGKQDEAESLLLEVREGLGCVLGVISDDTVKVGYMLADIYAETDRMEDADYIIEDMTQKHIKVLGYEDRKTQQHVLYCVELLNTWHRAADALAFLNRSYELRQALSLSHIEPGPQRRPRARDKGKSKAKSVEAANKTLPEIARAIVDNSDPAGIDYALGVARSYIMAGDKAAEALLIQISRHCEEDYLKFPIQVLVARSALLQLYKRLDIVNNNVATFENSKNVFDSVENSYNWDRNKYQCIDVMEAAMQLAADTLKGGFSDIARNIFQKVNDRAMILFGFADERTVWIQITIGLAYQTYAGWIVAKEWFNKAFAGALSKWDFEDGIVRSLQNAFDKGHFSYLSDEGRPFKTIFGVSGITIRPGRLHLE